MRPAPPSPEGPPPREERGPERRLTILSLILLALAVGTTGWTAWRVLRVKPHLPAGPGDHGPLPPAGRDEVLALVEPHLEKARLLEIREQGRREFRLVGKPKALLSQDFYRPFRPLVAERLKPLLTPYGEVLSFEITSLDLPPMRLREFDGRP